MLKRKVMNFRHKVRVQRNKRKSYVYQIHKKKKSFYAKHLQLLRTHPSDLGLPSQLTVGIPDGGSLRKHEFSYQIQLSGVRGQMRFRGHSCLKVTTDQAVCHEEARPTSAPPEKRKCSSELHHLFGDIKVTKV